MDQPLIARVSQALLAMQRYTWEQGVAAQAFLELGETKWVVQLAIEAVHRQTEDGRLAIIGPLSSESAPVTDPAANGEPVLYAARITGNPAFQQAADRMLTYLLHTAPRAQDGTLYHITLKRQVWIDAAYMAPPFLAVAGQPGEAIRQIEGRRRLLWNPDKRLYSHIWDDDLHDFARKDYWGVGNGWMAAGLARVIAALPSAMEADKQRLVAYLKDGLDGALVYQRPDGLFHNVIDNPDTFVETNLAQMLAYTIYRGLQGGWLASSYRATADRMRQAVHGKVDSYGLVQGVCGAPTFDHAGTAPEGQAFFLLMEAAAADQA